MWVLPVPAVWINFAAMDEDEILGNLRSRLGIESLNGMQKAMIACAGGQGDVILLSPTGTGKTVAYLVPLLKELREPRGQVQALIIAPSRELVIQIGGVAAALAGGHKVTCCYGGHNVADERNSLSVAPSVLVATPGRLLDHITRGHTSVESVSQLVLDEFDKSLELGFHDEMRRVLAHMPHVGCRVLTSATMIGEFPAFLRLNKPRTLNFLRGEERPEARTTVWGVASPDKDKLATALALLRGMPGGRAIIFVNHREAAERVAAFLRVNGAAAGLYHGGLDQQEREMAVDLFNNGTHAALVATDLGSRGLDIAGVTAIVHYHLPTSREAYIHRNGRTARMTAAGEVYVILAQGEAVPEYIKFDGHKAVDPVAGGDLTTATASLYFHAGKKEKISKGDIVGFLAANGGVTARQIGQIALRDHYAIVAVPRQEADQILARIAKLRIKNKRVRVTRVE